MSIARIKTETVLFTPEKAAQLLSNNTRNRSLSDKLVQQYASDMANNNWQLTHQGIALYDDSTVADGQHRLAAVVLSGRSVLMMLTTGLPKATGGCIDVMRPRSQIDSIKIGEMCDWINKSHIAVVNYLYRISRAKNTRLSNNNMVFYADQIKTHLLFLNPFFSAKRRGVTQVTVGAAMVTALVNGVDKSEITRFYHVLLSGMPELEHDLTCIRLREFLLNRSSGENDTTRRETFLKTQRAIKAHADKVVLGKLQIPSEIIYQFDFIDSF